MTPTRPSTPKLRACLFVASLALSGCADPIDAEEGETDASWRSFGAEFKGGIVCECVGCAYWEAPSNNVIMFGVAKPLGEVMFTQAESGEFSIRLKECTLSIPFDPEDVKVMGPNNPNNGPRYVHDLSILDGRCEFKDLNVADIWASDLDEPALDALAQRLRSRDTATITVEFPTITELETPIGVYVPDVDVNAPTPSNSLELDYCRP